MPAVAAQRTDEGLEPEEREGNVATDLERAAELFELWRLCCKAQCRRARACRGDARACCEMLVDWAGALSLKDKRVGFDEAIKQLREVSGEADSLQPAKNVIPAQAGIQRAKRK